MPRERAVLLPRLRNQIVRLDRDMPERSMRYDPGIQYRHPHLRSPFLIHGTHPDAGKGVIAERPPGKQAGNRLLVEKRDEDQHIAFHRQRGIQRQAQPLKILFAPRQTHGHEHLVPRQNATPLLPGQAHKLLQIPTGRNLDHELVDPVPAPAPPPRAPATVAPCRPSRLFPQGSAALLHGPACSPARESRRFRGRNQTPGRSARRRQDQSDKQGRRHHEKHESHEG